ncbi:MAG: cytidine deaminase [Firmicutes bacterium]|nr:cytidine deaminase [Bacillota bacterium]
MFCVVSGVPIVNLDHFDFIDKPEIIFGLVGAVGTPLKQVTQILKEQMEIREYSSEEIELSKFLCENLPLRSSVCHDGGEYSRIDSMMNRGNELRERTDGGEVLSLLAAAKIHVKRSEDHLYLNGQSFILRQLKHPEEVFCLRRIYGSSFHLIGVYSSEASRRQNLLKQGMSSDQVDRIFARDEGEELLYGQQLRDTYYLADVFVADGPQLEGQLQRYLKLLFAEEVITPSADEYGMHLSYSASLKSGDLSRQVGAAILNEHREVISLGANEVPAPMGGQYWEDSPLDSRDCRKGYDSNAKIKREIVEDIIKALQLSDDVEQVSYKLKNTRLMDITEFGRCVHAEMESILGAGRVGISCRQGTLYTTTFPCHNCAKHIVNAGLQRVVYIEPYPKSMAKDLHDDAIAFTEDGEGEETEKVIFEPFVGVAPRKYWILFSIYTADGRRLKRKDDEGNLVDTPLGLRLATSTLTYIERERVVAAAVSRIKELLLK